MARLAGMDEERRAAGRGQGRGDLAGDMAALAHAGHDDPPVDGAEPVQRLDEAPVQRIGERGQAGGFQRQHAARRRQIRFAARLAVRLASGGRGRIRGRIQGGRRFDLCGHGL